MGAVGHRLDQLLAAAGPAEDQFGVANGFFINKDYDFALEEYQKLLKAFPDFAKGDEASFYGVLEFREFNDGPDGNPSLTLDGYPAVPPKP